MLLQQIPHQQWPAFFDSFSRQHRGWLVSLELINAGGAQALARDLALEGIDVDMKSGGEDRISIVLTNPPAEHFSNTITAPTRVTLKKTEEGAHEALQIESASGPTTVLRFRSAMLPEMVDDIA